MSYNNGNNRNYNHSTNKLSQLKLDQEKLPVFKYKDEILSCIKNNSITLILGETGSGKTTQIPQYLLEWDAITASSKIVCTQPRTVAATSVALRVSYEQECELGTRVGFHIRLDRKVTDGVTKLEYMTEGVLLRKAMNCGGDLWREYKVIIIDEAHERTVNADLLMGFLKEMVCNKNKTDNDRNNVHLIIMSATLDTFRFCRYFDSPPIISIPGSLHPIQHYWLTSPTEDYIKLTIDTILSIHCSSTAVSNISDNDESTCKPDGHILVFLTGQQEIDAVVSWIRSREISEIMNPFYNFTLDIHPLYASLNSRDRQRAFDEPVNIRQTRKCVVATNIAETSLTISNVVYVIDCGLSKQKVYSPSKGVEALGIRSISKASVKQRIGRAGRVSPGKAFHLYTQIGYNQFDSETRAEILRSGLVSETLSMLALGMSNPLQFDFIDAPNEKTMARAINILHHLGAMDDDGAITATGYAMAAIPVNPRMAKCLLSANEYDCVYEMIVIAAMLENVERLYRKPSNHHHNHQDHSTDHHHNHHHRSEFRFKKRAFYHVSGDHLTLLNIYNAYKNRQLCGGHSAAQLFCKSNYLDLHTLQRADQIKSQLEHIVVSIAKSKSGGGKSKFKLNHHRYSEYYTNIIECLLNGYFMNVAVKGFGGKYWRFRILTLDQVDNNVIKTVDIIDKASCHPTSMFYKNQCGGPGPSGGNGERGKRNWIIFDEVQMQPSNNDSQLKVLTAVQPIWLIKTNPKYYNLNALSKDKSPIAKVLIASATAAAADN